MALRRPHVLVVGANPAWQTTLQFRHLSLGEVNRAYNATSITGGKGVNTVTALRQLGIHCTVLQFAGGTTAEQIRHDLEARGIRHTTVATRSNTRTCTTLLADDSSRMTELIEPSEPVTATEAMTFRNHFRDLLKDIDGVAICGTHPPGVPRDFYASLISDAKNRALVVLDAYKDVQSALAAGPDILKINTQELAEATGETHIEEAARTLFVRYPIQMLGLTAGPSTAYLFTREHACRFDIPKVRNIQNPLGAGDTVTAVLTARLAQRTSRQHAGNFASLAAHTVDELATVFREALATATASCMTQAPARFAADKAREIMATITVADVS